MGKLETTPTCDIIDELSRLEKEITLKTLKYNLLIEEITRRFPFLEKEESFREKEILTKQKTK